MCGEARAWEREDKNQRYSGDRTSQDERRVKCGQEVKLGYQYLRTKWKKSKETKIDTEDWKRIQERAIKPREENFKKEVVISNVNYLV